MFRKVSESIFLRENGYYAKTDEWTGGVHGPIPNKCRYKKLRQFCFKTNGQAIVEKNDTIAPHQKQAVFVNKFSNIPLKCLSHWHSVCLGLGTLTSATSKITSKRTSFGPSIETATPETWKSKVKNPALVVISKVSPNVWHVAGLWHGKAIVCIVLNIEITTQSASKNIWPLPLKFSI